MNYLTEEFEERYEVIKKQCRETKYPNERKELEYICKKYDELKNMYYDYICEMMGMAVINAIIRTNYARITCGGDSLAKGIAGLVESELSDYMSIPIVGTNIKDGNLNNLLEPFEEFDECPTLRFVVKLEERFNGNINWCRCKGDENARLCHDAIKRIEELRECMNDDEVFCEQCDIWREVFKPIFEHLCEQHRISYELENN